MKIRISIKKSWCKNYFVSCNYNEKYMIDNHIIFIFLIDPRKLLLVITAHPLYKGMYWCRDGKGTENLNPTHLFLFYINLSSASLKSNVAKVRIVTKEWTTSTLRYSSYNGNISKSCFWIANVTVFGRHYFSTWHLSQVTQSEWFLSSKKACFH